MLAKGFLFLVVVLLVVVAKHLVRGQRTFFEPCLSADLLRNCKQYEKPVVNWDNVTWDLETECETIIVDYFFEDYFLVEDPDERVQRLGGIPDNSDVCDTLKEVFIHCYWCEIEVNCFQNYTLSCEDGVQPMYPELQEQEQDIDHDDIDWVELHDLCTELTEELLGVEWDHDFHYELLVNIHVVEDSPEWCSKLRWAYSQCYWCKTGTEHYPQDYCSVKDWCRDSPSDTHDATNNTTANIDYVNDAGDVEETCHELDIMLTDFWKKTPMTHNQCDSAEMVVKHGPCRQRQCEPCFDNQREDDYLDLCQSLDHHKKSVQEWPLQEIVGACWDIWFEFHLDPYNATYHALRLGQLRAADEQCPRFQKVYPSCFWCNQDLVQGEVSCDEQVACRHMPRPLDEMDPALRDEFGTGETICDELRLLPTINMFPTTADLCLKAQTFSQYCPCSKAVDDVPFDYLGADTEAKKRALIWISRVAAFLSLTGGVYILWDSLFHVQKRRTTYHQLLIGMAIFDVCTAVAWSFATAPIDATDIDGKGYNFHGAKGTKATCDAQAFFIQLGATSIFYNVSLATYYVLVIVHGKREIFLQKVRPYMHGIPIVAGCGLALGGLANYGSMGYGCHISPLPYSDLSAVLIFVGLPIGLSICYITLAMLLVYSSVRTTSRASRRWRFGIGSSKSLEQRVFWQAVCYTMSFYITWPILFWVYFGELDNRKYWLAVLVSFVAPLQGFNNFLVYFRSQYSGQAKVPRSSSTFTMIKNHFHSSGLCPCWRLSRLDQEESPPSEEPERAAEFAEAPSNAGPESANTSKQTFPNKEASENAANAFMDRISGMDPSVVIAFEESEVPYDSGVVPPTDKDAPMEEVAADREDVKDGSVLLGNNPEVWEVDDKWGGK